MGREMGTGKQQEMGGTYHFNHLLTIAGRHIRRRKGFGTEELPMAQHTNPQQHKSRVGVVDKEYAQY